MIYTLYKITNNINGKIYIGVHKTENIDDGYMGSGKILKQAFAKYGIENFTKEILHTFDTQEEMFDMESQLVNEDFVKRSDTYNIKEGGFGGWDYSNTYIKNQATISPLGIKALRLKIKNDPDFKKIFQDVGSKNFKQMHRDGKSPYGNRKGCSLTEEHKHKIGKANSKHQKGKGNSQYGTCWIYCPYTHNSRKIPRYELDKWLDDGWVKGRKICRD